MKTNALLLATLLSASSAYAAEVATLEYPYYNTESEYVIFTLYDDASDIEECKGKLKASATYHISIAEGRVDSGCWYLDGEDGIVYLQLQGMRAPYVIHRSRFNANYTGQEATEKSPLAGICPVNQQQ